MKKIFFLIAFISFISATCFAETYKLLFKEEYSPRIGVTNHSKFHLTFDGKHLKGVRETDTGKLVDLLKMEVTKVAMGKDDNTIEFYNPEGWVGVTIVYNPTSKNGSVYQWKSAKRTSRNFYGGKDYKGDPSLQTEFDRLRKNVKSGNINKPSSSTSTSSTTNSGSSSNTSGATNRGQTTAGSSGASLTPPAPEKPVYNGHEYVDLGLPSGLKWATCNVGAFEPMSIKYRGNLYAWADSTPKLSLNQQPSDKARQKMSNFSGEKDLDVATIEWKGKWRTPTKSEMQELVKNCKWEYISTKDFVGFKATGPNGNYIYFPVGTGTVAGNPVNSSYDANKGTYWTSTPDDANFAYQLIIYGNTHTADYVGNRNNGNFIRPVF